jgi:hypothetical protein
MVTCKFILEVKNHTATEKKRNKQIIRINENSSALTFNMHYIHFYNYYLTIFVVRRRREKGVGINNTHVRH